MVGVGDSKGADAEDQVMVAGGLLEVVWHVRTTLPPSSTVDGLAPLYTSHGGTAKVQKVNK